MGITLPVFIVVCNNTNVSKLVFDSVAGWVKPIAGENKNDKAAKVATARTLWVPAVINHGGFGRWAFLEVADPWDAKNLIRASLKKGTTR